MLTFIHPIANARALIEVLGVLIKRRGLAWEFTRRELGSRYAGQWVGSFWTIIHPLFLMALYVFIFGVVMGVRIGGTQELPLDYTAFILTGIIPWMFSQEVMSKSTTTISNNGNLVKQVVFPIEILPVTSVYASCVSALIALLGLGVYMVATGQGNAAMLPFLPVLIVLHVMFLAGLAFAFSAVSVFFRDLKDVVKIFCTAGLFLAPIIYLPQWVPELFKPIIYLNPFSYIVWSYRDVLYFGRFEHPLAWVVVIAISLLSLMGGYRTFRKLKPYFGDAL